MIEYPSSGPSDEELDAAFAANEAYDRIEQYNRTLYLLDELGRRGIEGVGIEAGVQDRYKRQLSLAYADFDTYSSIVGELLARAESSSPREREVLILDLPVCTSEELEAFSVAAGYIPNVGARTFHGLVRPHWFDKIEVTDITAYDPVAFKTPDDESSYAPRIVSWTSQESPRHAEKINIGVDRVSMIRALEGIKNGETEYPYFGKRSIEVLEAYCEYIQAVGTYGALIANAAEALALDSEAIR